MKSPRDILLEQHRNQSPVLDKIREQVVAEQATIASQRRTGILPVTERTACDELAQRPAAPVAVKNFGGAVNAETRERTNEPVLVSAGDRQDACPTLPATFRSWLTLNRAAWSSLAAAWVVIIALNVSANTGDESDAPIRSQADAREVLEGVKAYQSQLALLLFDSESVEEQNQIAEPKNPGPRSEAPQPCRHA